MNIDTTYFDEQFSKITNLTWFPWVGKNYSMSRLLIIGESHYTNTNFQSEVAEKKNRLINWKEYTRDVVREYPLLGYSAGWINNGGRRNNPTFDNLHKTLTTKSLLDEIDLSKRLRLWEKIAYVNIIQRPMWFPPLSKYPQERPSLADFEIGWETIVQLISVLSPDICLFAGLSSSNSYTAMMDKLNISHEVLSRGDEKIGHGYPRRSSACINGKSVDLLFIQHPSKFFIWKEWRKFIFSNYPLLKESFRYENL